MQACHGINVKKMRTREYFEARLYVLSSLPILKIKLYNHAIQVKKLRERDIILRHFGNKESVCYFFSVKIMKL